MLIDADQLLQKSTTENRMISIPVDVALSGDDRPAFLDGLLGCFWSTL
jgi:hypothetical protein